jgi:hypothetical protein
MPTRRVGEKVPLVTSPDRRPVAQHAHVGARDAAVERLQAPTAAAPPLLLLAHQGVASPEPRLGEPDGPGGPRLHRGDLERQVLPVQRVAHLGAQRVPGAEAARAHTEVRAVLQQGVPDLARVVPGRQQLEASSPV